MRDAPRRDYRTAMTGYELEPNGRRDAAPVAIAVIAEPGAACEQALAAVRAIDGGVATVLGWGEVAAAGGARIWPGIVLAETDGVADDLLAAALAPIEAGARASHAAIVVALASGQIDLVAGTLFGTQVQLLCAASVADRVAALALARPATGRPAGVADPARDAAGERLRRLSDDVARIAATLATLAHEEMRGDGVGDRTGTYDAGPDRGPEVRPDESPPLAITAAELRGAIRSRRLRDTAFGPGWFEDPAWDMLLDLFAAELEGARVSVSSLCIAAAVAPTTALRWMTRMTDAGLLRRESDPGDRRRVFVALTDSTRAAMRRYCSATQRSGLGIA